MLEWVQTTPKESYKGVFNWVDLCKRVLENDLISTTKILDTLASELECDFDLSLLILIISGLLISSTLLVDVAAKQDLKEKERKRD